MVIDLASFVQRVTGASRVERAGRIQSLWGGYGELLRFRLEGTARATVVVKWARPPAERRRGEREPPVSHERKCRSYDAETAFYRALAPRCDDTCRVAQLLGAETGDDEWVLVLEDLDAAGFDRRSRAPRGADLDACLAWLASFHARFLGASAAGAGVWSVGSYWHLATRQDELRLAAMTDPSLAERAAALDRELRAARFTTLVHGDAKPANFCFARVGRAGPAVAAVDFQYTGGGPGVVDVAYLLHGDPPDATQRSVDTYFARLRDELPGDPGDAGVDGAALEREWRALLPTARADFDRFLVGWRR